MGYLIDTCIWVDVERGKLSAADVADVTADEEVFLSPVTIAELQVGVEMATNPAVQQARQRSVDLLKRKPVLRIDEETGAVWGRMSALLQKTGRGAQFRVMDLWLAAQALQFNLVLLTRNKKDFEDIPGLRLAVLDPPQPRLNPLALTTYRTDLEVLDRCLERLTKDLLSGQRVSGLSISSVESLSRSLKHEVLAGNRRRTARHPDTIGITLSSREKTFLWDMLVEHHKIWNAGLESQVQRFSTAGIPGASHTIHSVEVIMDRFFSDFLGTGKRTPDSLVSAETNQQSEPDDPVVLPATSGTRMAIVLPRDDFEVMRKVVLWGEKDARTTPYEAKGLKDLSWLIESVFAVVERSNAEKQPYFVWELSKDEFDKLDQAMNNAKPHEIFSQVSVEPVESFVPRLVTISWPEIWWLRNRLQGSNTGLPIPPDTSAAISSGGR